MVNRRFFSLALMAATLKNMTGCQKPTDKPQSATSSATSTTTTTANKTLAITAIVDHPAFEAVKKGIVDELAAEGLKEGQNLTLNYQSAQGNAATAGQIAKQFTANNPDAIVAISTASAQAVLANTKTLPVIFAAITDPVAAKLVPSLAASGTNVTGSSNAMPMEPQIALLKEVLPNAKRIGYVYSPGEVNSSVVLKNLKAKAEPMGYVIQEAPATSSTDIANAIKSLAGKVDVIYTPTDNHLMSAYESAARAATESKIPLFSMDTSTVARGAPVAIGVDYYDLGKETGKIVGQVLQGKAAGSIPTYTTKNLKIFVSPKNAAAQGITIPKSVLDKADKVVE